MQLFSLIRLTVRVFAFFLAGAVAATTASALAPNAAVAAPDAAPLSHETPQLEIEAGGHTARVMRVLFRPSGTADAAGGELISIGADKTIRVWRTDGSGAVRVLRGFSGGGMRGAFYAAAADPTGHLLAVTGFDGAGTDARVHLYDLDSGRIVRALTHANNGITDLAFSPDGQRLAACSDRSNPLWVWNLDSGVATEFKGHREAVNQIAFSPDGQRLASAGADNTARIWDVARAKSLLTLPTETEARSIAFSPDNHTVATGDENGQILLWNVGSPTANTTAAGEPRRLPTLSNPILSLAFGAGGATLIAGQGERTPDFTVHVWDVATGAPHADFHAHKNSVISVALSPDGTRAASADADGAVYLWDAATGGTIQPLAASSRAPTGVAWREAVPAGNGAGAAGGAPDYVVGWSTEPDFSRNASPQIAHAFDLRNAAPLAAPLPTAGWHGAVTAMGTRRLLLSDDRLSVRLLDGDREVARLQMSEDRLPQTLPGGVTLTRRQDMDRTNEIRSFSFTPDGRIVVGSVFSLALFRADGKWAHEFVGHSGEVIAVSVSPDGRYLVSAALDQTIRIWRLDGGDAGGGASVTTPLLNLFQDSRERWVAWTEAGYFAAAPGGDQLIGWRVNRGPDQEAEFYRADQFWKLFYRPDVLVRVLASGSVAAAVAEADVVAGTVTPRTDPQKTVAQIATFAPPHVDLTDAAVGLTASLTSDADHFTVHARITDPNGRRITRVFARVNASAGRGLDFGNVAATPGTALDWSDRVALQTGENTITIVAENDQETQSAPVYLHVTYRPPVPRKPNLYLLAVGVSHYATRAVNSLSYAAKDARDFSAAYSKQTNLFDHVDTTILTDDGATHESIDAALEKISYQDVRADDYVIIFLSGHGTPVDPLHGNREYCFVPTNVAIGHFAETAVPGRSILNHLQALPCNVLIVLDTCRSGSAVLRADDPNLTMQYLAGQIQYGRVLILSCGPTETSQENDTWQNGAFTKSFVQGLSGAAGTTASNAENAISLLDMEDYLTREVAHLTGGAQNPRVDVPSYVPLKKASFVVGKVAR